MIRQRCLKADAPVQTVQSELTDFNPKTLGRQDISMTQKAKIVFEVEETVVLKQGGKIVPAYCPRCDELVDMVSPDVLALVTNVSEREIFRLLETGIIHFVETGRIYVCPGCYQRTLEHMDLPDERIAAKGETP